MKCGVLIAVKLGAIVALTAIPVSCSGEHELPTEILVDTLAQSDILLRLERLPTARESLCSPYDVNDYSYSQSLELEIIVRDMGIYDPYQDEWYQSRDTTDIEHIISRKEAHESGLCAKPDSVRRNFARDLPFLVLTHMSINRSKGDRDAADWMPLQNRCWFAERVLAIREQYTLTIDEREKTKLREQIESCGSFSKRMSPNPFPNLLTDSSKGCGPYANCDALRQDYPDGVSIYHCAYREQMDRNKDGWICADN